MSSQEVPRKDKVRERLLRLRNEFIVSGGMESLV